MIVVRELPRPFDRHQTTVLETVPVDLGDAHRWEVDSTGCD